MQKTLTTTALGLLAVLGLSGAATADIVLGARVSATGPAAFSDFHVTGANPAGNASLTDTAFVAARFRRAMWRRPAAA